MRLKNVGLDVAEILLKRSVPVTAGTLAGIMATAMTGQPAAGIAASIIAGYGAQMAVNKIDAVDGSSGSGLYSGGQIAGGLYAGSQGRYFDSMVKMNAVLIVECLVGSYLSTKNLALEMYTIALSQSQSQ